VSLSCVALIPAIVVYSRNAVGLVLVFGCAAAVTYFGYELLTTRRLSAPRKICCPKPML